MKEKGHRTLGYNAIPSNYNLKIEPNLSTFEYFCSETVDIQIKKKTKKVKMNSRDLNIIKVLSVFKEVEQAAKVAYDEKNEEVTLTFPKFISGKGKIYIEFSGKNTDSLCGFYRSKYRVGD